LQAHLIASSLHNHHINIGYNPPLIQSMQREESAMKKRNLCLAALFSFLALILNTQSVLAHESITVGDYTIEVGWLSEPPIVGQHNAFVLNVSRKSDGQPVEDISSLTLTISYGGQEKSLTPEHVNELSHGQFMAPVVPTVPGQYTLIIGGRLDETTFVDVHMEPEEVQPADTLAFPNVASTENAGFGLTEWLAIAGFVSGLAALIISLLNMRNRR
jgi:hypothetical protein